MKPLDRNFRFEGVYRVLSNIESCIETAAAFGFAGIDWEDHFQGMLRPNKLSLLQHFIFAVISGSEREMFQDSDDLYIDSYFNDDDLMLGRVYSEFGAYEIAVEKFEAEDNDDAYEAFKNWLEDQSASFEKLWKAWADEAFHILFMNRTLLTKFNITLADYWQSNPDILDKNLLTGKGKIPRISLPVWLKDAVFYRDRGRCVFCNRDISGLLDIRTDKHYDHIVPLNLHGTNDPTNFQLSCGACNIQKSGTSAITSYRYRGWWDY